MRPSIIIPDRPLVVQKNSEENQYFHQIPRPDSQKVIPYSNFLNYNSSPSILQNSPEIKNNLEEPYQFRKIQIPPSPYQAKAPSSSNPQGNYSNVVSSYNQHKQPIAQNLNHRVNQDRRPNNREVKINS